ncbi:flagellar basal body-associated FliL family protein [Comamonas aquatica]|uniref:Flagellar protein FliL n=2 Tax=Comamonas aquatica TaxID=225991 RepID=A0A014P2K2_9BURK|nr:flagellar basal body-associated FliL family protein [Comamonas aquatica]EXU80385.1 flagellar basal body protein FliL [Comamonas aquatica DA1877]MDH1815018.1 flagellar basal body-associated FliL family protein [Comamonas aquatica]CAB5692069.1 flagellar basal body-associated protein FliL [Comamonas aquatica]CAB5705995.1 flagellar basal body-associated protein FliL [Comamonas aquatica]CAC9179660.1 flagellar basal body-associated protein FliL [Comamonas aquatica]
MAATNPAAAPAPAKSKKLIIIGAIVALLVVAVAAVALFVMNRSQHSDPYGEEAPAKSAATVVPTFLPLENMVVNLADPGGDRFAQVGITLELQDEATATTVKQYMPSIRNGILMLVSQRTADELLQREGKEKLASDILREVTRPLGMNAARPQAAQAQGDEDEARPAARRSSSPVRRVLFSSFIIQ